MFAAIPLYIYKVINNAVSEKGYIIIDLLYYFIYPFMFGLGFLIVPLFCLKVNNRIQDVRNGNVNKTINNKKKSNKKAKIIIIVITAVALIIAIFTFFTFQDMRGRYILDKGSNDLNCIVAYAKNPAKHRDIQIMDNTKKSLFIDFDYKNPEFMAISDDNVNNALSELYYKYNYKNNFLREVAYYDNNGKTLVEFNYYLQCKFLNIPRSKAILYIDEDFNLNCYDKRGKLNKIKNNWYILTY